MTWFDDTQFRNAVRVAAWLLVALLAVVLVYVLSSIRYVGAGITPGNTIAVSGYGESYSTPDIATFSYSVVSDKPTVAAAQADATAKANAITAYLKGAGIDTKDIQTSEYSINPQYDFVTPGCDNTRLPCPGGQQVLKGYEVRQTTTIKVRDTAKAGDLLAGIGTKGATEVSGLQFTFDNPQQGQLEARGKAIGDAKAKADELAKELGVSLVRVVSFNESSGGTPVPMYAKALDSAAGTAVAQSAPELSVGQNKVTDNVSVTYEIR